MKGALLLDVVVGQSTPVLELLPSEDQAVLVWRDAFLVLNLRFHIIDGVGGLHIERDGFPGEGLHEDLHSSAEAEYQVKGALLIDVVIRQSASILKLLACKDKTLLVRRDAFLVLDLRFHIIYG